MQPLRESHFSASIVSSVQSRSYKMYVSLGVLLTNMASKSELCSGNEFCERLAFYGIATNLVIYLSSVMGLSVGQATIQASLFGGTCYLTPLIGAWLADGYIGRFRTIMFFSIIYALVRHPLPREVKSISARLFASMYSSSLDGQKFLSAESVHLDNCLHIKPFNGSEYKQLDFMAGVYPFCCISLEDDVSFGAEGSFIRFSPSDLRMNVTLLAAEANYLLVIHRTILKGRPNDICIASLEVK
jgi:hypothetical protein